MTKIERAESKPGPGNIGFAVLCPGRNLGGLMTTVRTLKGIHPQAPLVCVLPEDATDKEMEEFRKACPVHRGGRTVQSLANLGFEKCRAEWVMTLMAGVVARPGLLRHYERFGEATTDVFYAIVRGKWRFEDNGFTGFAAHRDTFLKVGKFAEQEENLELVRLFWGMDAAESGCRIKGLVGVAV